MARTNTGSTSSRKRRDILRTTDEEFEQIRAFANEAGMSINMYPITCALEGRPAPRRDQQQKLQKIIQAVKALDEIAHAVSIWPAESRGLALFVLRRIETFILDDSSDSSDLLFDLELDEPC